MAKANGGETEQPKQAEKKPFCAVYGVGKNEQQPNESTTANGRRGEAGNRTNIHIEQQQYDENSYLSVNRTQHIFGWSDEEGRRALAQRNINDLLADNEQQQNAITTLSPFRVFTTLTNCENADWDELREVRVRELAEARQRVMFMENTMRCERSRLREENLRLRNALAFAKVELIGQKNCENSSGDSAKNIHKNGKLIYFSPKIDNLQKYAKIIHKESEEFGSNSKGRRRTI
ncbi:hypothetical protein niasHT_003534 [Heterodera trifolii]|uniref:Uncharacterized protein n=1 Tax=Heterodera trifolii TaxID=157864 RepID=A0ABD2M2J6_9BILA